MTDSSFAMTPQQKQMAEAQSRSAFTLYRHLSVGDKGFFYFLGYEVALLCSSWVPGAPGFGLRMLLYPWMFGSYVSKPVLGAGISIKRPSQLHFGKGVVADRDVCIDVRGDEGTISFGDGVLLGRWSSVVSKEADIILEGGVNVGSHCRIASQSRIHIGESTLVAAYCYIGPGNHTKNGERGSFIDSGMEKKGGVFIGAHCWLGTRVTVLDGVTIGDGAVIGAHSLVKSDIPSGVVAAGVPAKVLGSVDEIFL